MWRSSLVSFTLFFDLSEWKPWIQCMSVVAQDRQNVIYMYGGLLCQSELSCMRLIRPWFCSKSAALALLSICYVIHVFCYADQLLCSWMPSKGSKNLPQKRRVFFQFPYSPMRRKQWIYATQWDKGKQFTITEGTKVCSQHLEGMLHIEK